MAGSERREGRRDFLKAAAAGIVGLVVGAAIGSSAFPRRETITETTTQTTTVTQQTTVTQTVTQTVAPTRVTAVNNDLTWRVPGKKHIVVVGGGPGGAAFTRELLHHFPGEKPFVITIVDRHNYWVSGPSHTDFVAGEVPMEKVTVSIDNLAVKDAVRVVYGTVTSLDPQNRVVYTEVGKISYDYLVLSPGIDLAWWEVENLDKVPNYHAWYPSTALALREKALALPTGGKVVFAVPSAPYKCPPAPYEVTLLTAEAVKAKGVKVTLIDANANPQPPPKAKIFREWIDKQGVEYISGQKVVRVDPAAKVVETDKGEKFSFDLISILPRNLAPAFVRNAGLGATFMEVDVSKFRSKKFDDVFGLGDHIAAPYTKSMYAAVTEAQRLADIFADMFGKRPAEIRKVNNVCWSYVSKNFLTRIEVWWDDEGKTMPGYPKVDEPTEIFKQHKLAWVNSMLARYWGP
ncbi:MAG: FAD-dependent oxidoreductase [Pyrobaculum sp.]